MMLFAIRGTDEETQQDVSMVVEADTPAEAEYIARRRGFPVIIVASASEDDVIMAKAQGLFCCHAPPPRYTAFGYPVGRVQLACLMLCGLATIDVLLRSFHMPLWS